MSVDAGFFSSGAWLLGLGEEDLRGLAKRLEAGRDEIFEGRYRLRCFAVGIQFVGVRPRMPLPLPLLQAVAGELRCELKVLWAAQIFHRGSNFFECQYEHWRGTVCLRRLSTGPILGDSIGWVGVDGAPEPWEAQAFARPPQRGQATFATGWERLWDVATGEHAPTPTGSSAALAEAEVIGAKPRLSIG
jgi:hypothetical protein